MASRLAGDIQADYLWYLDGGRIEEGIRFIRQWKGAHSDEIAELDMKLELLLERSCACKIWKIY